MPSSSAVAEAAALLSGELRDAAGASWAEAGDPPCSLATNWRHTIAADAKAAAALTSGRRAMVVIPLTGPSPLGRGIAVVTARLALLKARRALRAAGATTLRTFAMVATGDTLFALYELGGMCQPYVESHILPSGGGSGAAAAAKTILGVVSGVAIGADALIVVGERP